MFFKHFLSKSRIYLDHASSTPLDYKMLSSFPAVPSWCSGANPGALHKEAVALKKFLKDARSLVAKTLGSQSDEIIFTSSATESDNLAIFGFIKNKIESGVNPKDIVLYVSPFEHSAIEESLNHLYEGVKVCKLVQESGYVLLNSINIPGESKIILISVIFVQNEIGTVQPIKEIAKRVRKLRKEYPDKEIIFHTDATQAPLYYDLNVARLGVDMMTLGATKLYCHKGVGMLYKRRSVKLSPILYGGGQEMGLRPGTEPVELIHSFAHALSYAQARYERAHTHTRELQQYFENKITKILPLVCMTARTTEGNPPGFKVTHLEAQLLSGRRSPHITHLVVPEMDSELLVLELDARGIAVSSKSACKNDQDQDSGIMQLLYPNQNLGAIRISYGRKTTKSELDRTIEAIRDVLTKYSKSAILKR